MNRVYDFSVKTIDGRSTTLGDYKGMVLLIVNVASRCGLTPQYSHLEALHRRFKDRGFSVLGFPANDFGAQEPGTRDQHVLLNPLRRDVRHVQQGPCQGRRDAPALRVLAEA